jgi:hypothetical protein
VRWSYRRWRACRRRDRAGLAFFSGPTVYFACTVGELVGHVSSTVAREFEQVNVHARVGF